MSAPIVIGTGSTAGAILMDIQRRILQKIRQAEDDKEQLDSLKAIQIIAFDTDRTHAYVVNKPLNDPLSTLPPGQFLHCSLPGVDLIDSIESGRQPGKFETINPRAMRGLKHNSQGAGGTPPNGLLAYLNNEASIEQKIRNSFRRNILKYNHTETQQTLSVFLLGTGFGGTASVSWEWLKQKVWQIAHEMNLEINLNCIFLLPGAVNQPKDPMNSLAVTFACLKEQVAISTGYYVHRQRKGHENLQTVPTRHSPTILISDTNGAGEPHGLSRENQASMVAELLLTWIATPLGCRRDAQADDFQNRAATELTLVGEPKAGISAGLSLIVLGRKRLQRYTVLKLKNATLTSLLTETEDAVAQAAAQTFVVRHRLLAGQGETELVNRLCQEPTELGSQATPARVSSMIDTYTQELTGAVLATQGEMQANLASSQALEPADNWEEVTDERKTNIVREVQEDLEQSLLNILRTESLTATRQFLNKLLQLLKHITHHALDDHPRYEEQVTTATQEKEQAQTQLLNLIQQIDQKKRSFNYQIFSALGFAQTLTTKIKQRISQGNRLYRTRLKNDQIAQMKQIAHFGAVEVLEALQKVVNEQLLQVQQAEETIRQLQDTLQNELDRLIAYNPDFECPNGLHLHRTETDLEATYPRLLPENDETKGIYIISRSLLGQESILTLLTNPESLCQQLEEQAKRLIQRKLDGLHVVKELRHRYPQETDLGRVLMSYGDHCSHEFIQLKDSADANGLYVLRLLGIDLAQAGNLPELVNQYSYDERRQPYEVRDTGDSDQIVFWQERHLFAYSDWKQFETAQDAYRQVSQTSDFEKLHPVVGVRCLMTPGNDGLSELDAKTLIIRAWLLGYIRSIPQDNSHYQIDAFDYPLPLKSASLSSSQGYCYSVAIISHFNCLFLEKGVQYIYERLNYLLGVRDSQVAPLNRLDTVVAPFYTDAVKDLLLEQLQWWEHNSVLPAMEWWGKVG